MRSAHRAVTTSPASAAASSHRIQAPRGGKLTAIGPRLLEGQALAFKGANRHPVMAERDPA